MFLPFVVSVLLVITGGFASAQTPYTLPARGTTATLPANRSVALVNPDQGIVYVGEEMVGVPSGQCTYLAGMPVVVEGADNEGVLVEYRPTVSTPPPGFPPPCPTGALFLIEAAEWAKLKPVYGPAEAAAAWQRERVRLMLLR